ncbi:adenosylmethionine--8-amino-7-oxononanoate transaminase [filamentous cyanobacterium LEGE 11480]|uniref:Adenosylmethionine-8-amino-7-oxononanoate aminotransferase n=1 Tax=Romeriopsis navalis LEGE 11480 TaxID=2777977 RepID=A0A928Z235_9CYAN|nr:adenosylmethionine--8-amino-7-oxononanoate transaminase [Romeriopsis navalis]MBE9029986.1 adenosylmethionine--8-amino-7-oxononanoate transaminase [Romeriopsis navalis LEGE 11480]
MHPNIWHPFTQAKTAPEPLKVKSAQGIWLTLEDERQVMDCISSWWVNTHGHAHPQIAEAIYQQALKMEHVIFGGFTHDPAEQFAEQLVPHLPPGLTRVFFSDNGSTSVEVALKMAYQYWRNLHQPRSTFMAFDGGYHGDTFGTMAVGSRSIFSAVFRDMLFEIEYVDFPATYIGDAAAAQTAATALEKIESELKTQRDRYAGIIIEPLVQGAGGMRMCRPDFLQGLRKLCDDYDVLLIFDEVMTGFGRTGHWFASDRAAIAPDIMCLSKGITGGFLPFAATVCSEKIYAAFYSDDPLKTLYHGHSYTANPLGCAAAIASLKLMQENQPKFAAMEALHQQHCQQLIMHPRVEQLRIMGTIMAFDVVTPSKPGYLNTVGRQIRDQAIDRGLLLRPLGNVLYLLPPYCITEEELAMVYQAITEILDGLA